MNIAHLLRRSAMLHGRQPAVLHGDQVLWTYETLGARTAALAAWLRTQCGVVPGDRVAIYAANAPEYLEALHAIVWAGAVSVPVNYKLHAKELAYVLADSGARVVLASQALAPAALKAGALESGLLVFGSEVYRAAVSHAPMDVCDRAPQDVASLFYTSGTTGRPKGVMQTHRNLLAMTACYFTDVDDIAPGDAMVYAAPLSHGAGLYNYAQVLRGGRHVVPLSGGFEPAELVQLAARVRQLTLFAAPTMVHRLVDHVRATGADGSGFKTIIYGGGPMYADDLRTALDTLGNRFAQIYGQGESPMTITALSRAQLADRDHPRWAERMASVGVAQSLVDVRVVDAAGHSLPAGETGEVVVRGDTVMPGYWNNLEATAQTLRDGWLYTGDMGSLDGDGFLTLKDRSKDVIISGGSNIYPREVEEVLLQHPQVREVAVVGQRDAEWGEVVVAFLVAGDSGPVEDAVLDALCLEYIARFKRPKEYRWVEALPKNSYGKVLKTELRELG
ncbi:MAG: AMP-binding protein [Gammaproteobacteria bacterium]|nr:AMP-binding protein [Gammaproteobacteria bacterium]MBU1504967.1 AMP-binding protein [Gammaproteobacteria bacterium]MBU2198733.1 AMP-binding protein [Gammaproteobacteria bacterium]MBU2273361.1 AMP-binding protein [Gammaproteobacteria bacterium]MBU2352864.1 AMP-binding protein [Gammaproteobacteria bacterium]